MKLSARELEEAVAAMRWPVELPEDGRIARLVVVPGVSSRGEIWSGKAWEPASDFTAGDLMRARRLGSDEIKAAGIPEE